MKKNKIRKLRVESPRNSLCGSAQLDKLCWDRWFTDNSFGCFYLQVAKEEEEGEMTYHRVYCSESEKPRLSMEQGILYWLVEKQ